MNHDHRYDCALAAALVILEALQNSSGEPKHQQLATTVFAILHAMDRYDEERGGWHGRFSNN